MKIYTGCRDADGCRIWVEEPGKRKRQLNPERSLKVRNHSPTGFEWGYCGSGPAQAALAILLDCIGDVAADTYQSFKNHVVARMPSTWELTEQEIMIWLAKPTDQTDDHYKQKWDGARTEAL